MHAARGSNGFDVLVRTSNKIHRGNGGEANGYIFIKPLRKPF